MNAVLRLLSVARTSGLHHPSLSLILVPLVPSIPCPCSLRPFSLASVLFRTRLSQPFYFAISFPRQHFLFFLFRPVCSSSLSTQPRPCFALYAHAFPASRALRSPTACVSTAKSIDRNVFRSGRNEQEGNRRKCGMGRGI